MCVCVCKKLKYIHPILFSFAIVKITVLVATSADAPKLHLKPPAAVTVCKSLLSIPFTATTVAFREMSRAKLFFFKKIAFWHVLKIQCVF